MELRPGTGPDDHYAEESAAGAVTQVPSVGPIYGNEPRTKLGGPVP